ncbi:F-box protein At1g67340-like [Oryza brachyantha]|uniref:F-box protein At1g67340-like n=1 Tax=Oryza brachyantha TaxID=4533 RepID=UPI001ADB0C97|nr:F-box protein At1g67340-like [Oryza brachyantha]
MRTRRGACYCSPCQDGPRRKRRRVGVAEGPAPAGSGAGACGDMFDELPDDLVVSILADVAASARSPADLAGAMLTCKRFRELGGNKVVLARASPRCVAVRAGAWSDAAHRFLQRCADAGNLDACYLLGMIRFYCLGSRGSGAALMAAAAVGGHREALYSLAVIQFNGSGGTKDDRDLRAGAALCARAASLGHVDALRELGHCLQDGYGVRRSVLDGRRLLIQANARELAAAVAASASLLRAAAGGGGKPASRRHSCLLSDFGCHAAAKAGGEAHAANRFLVDWFASRPLAAAAATAAASATAAVSAAEDDGGAGGGGDESCGLRLCSHALCGRPETRRHEFRRCSVCGVVNYCSRACQALHWKTAHKAECTPMDRWLDNAVAPNAAAAMAAPAP